jgi:hypothetical protein
MIVVCAQDDESRTQSGVRPDQDRGDIGATLPCSPIHDVLERPIRKRIFQRVVLKRGLDVTDRGFVPRWSALEGSRCEGRDVGTEAANLGLRVLGLRGGSIGRGESEYDEYGIPALPADLVS